MKAAIVTLFGDNYGNKLQNYALQTILESLGNDVKTLRIKDGKKLSCPVSKKEAIRKLTPSYVYQVISSRIKNKYPYKNQRDGLRGSIEFGKTDIPQRLEEQRSEAFKKFSEKHLKLDEEIIYPGAYDYTDKYDAYVCGSDQIWNPTYSSTGAEYFLQFVPEHKRIAFAPSFGLNSINEALHPLYRKWLNGIPYLSVREEAGAGIIKELTGREAMVLPDPTLYLTKEQWEKVEKKPEFDIDQPYVLTYFLGNETNKYRRYIEAYAKRINARIIDLFDMREPEYYAVDPAEFVWLMHHAAAMFTDSFHGTVFSLIFHTPFLVFDRVESGGTGMSSRIDTLLNMAQLPARRFGMIESDKFADIDFSASDSAIAERAGEAKSFLQNALCKISAGCDKSLDEVPLQYVQPFRQDCTGCAACVGVCPVNCITMETDSEGFRYPKIDLNRCIHCDKCRKLCSDSQNELSDRNGEEAYVAFSKNPDVREASSSGGMFSVLADSVLAKGGKVYGAGFADDWSVEHRCANSVAELAGLRGSKYVQSDVKACYSEIKDVLEKGKQPVYFSGTPCQIDGLLEYLHKDYDNLFTQDIICHGVPSPKVWSSYLNIRTRGERIKKVSFRDKTYGWHYFSMKIETDKTKYIKRLDEDVFIRLFLENVVLRPSCYSCHHKHLHRKADITIADCWGGGMGMKDDDKGMSLVFANTEKGQKLLDSVKESLEVLEVPYEKAASRQGAMTKSVPYNKDRELFFSMADANGMEKAITDWYGYDSPVLLKNRINYRKYILSNLLRKN